MYGLHMGWEAAPICKIGLLTLLDFVDLIDIMLGFIGLHCHFLLNYTASNCSAICIGDRMLVIMIYRSNWALKHPNSDKYLHM